MLEKVIFVKNANLEEVNSMLEDGWRVKLIESTSSDGYCSAYFVLEKK